jgi:hypothetical protein
MNNEKLAEVYQADIVQIIIVWPNVWRHEPYGNWYLRLKYKEITL